MINYIFNIIIYFSSFFYTSLFNRINEDGEIELIWFDGKILTD